MRSADVVIENFSPGVMHRLSLSAEAVRAANPRCIYVSMPGFRSSDRTKAELKAFEAIIMTECKLSRVQAPLESECVAFCSPMLVRIRSA